MPIQNFRAFCREQMNASTFELSVVQVRDELPDLRDYATVEVTLDKNDPTKVQLRFRKDEDSED